LCGGSDSRDLFCLDPRNGGAFAWWVLKATQRWNSLSSTIGLPSLQSSSETRMYRISELNYFKKVFSHGSAAAVFT
jgi:hypothetical protein